MEDLNKNPSEICDDERVFDETIFKEHLRSQISNLFSV